ncbi:GTP cyclohydrolase 1 type 2 [Buchnera aphidicola (Cinara kochiana kochiana)]|uniref:GTP cyclohydrolase 1 type 2 n=1 Tax=Buchnera aphidicola (Cinara kochiana kochiana) TaxID=2518976 RepID=A0A451D5K7_9GAMM|nr:Nif3-like dinuclear metal center hexameric protein [Buchnera aphidicola]VFP81108.1 GTP cyclohydrolase 1 type 2 [Buchnera aphidicola (Cinara kochiana kochiana)]
MNNFFLEKIINEKLNSHKYKNDYTPNGLQVEGRSEIIKIITGVTACKNLLKVAIKQHADAIIVHHGYFWNNQDKKVLGMHRNRLKMLLLNDINLYSWHIPLDVHSKLGNNVQLGKLLNININNNINDKINPYILHGKFKKKHTVISLINIIKKKLNRTPFHYGKTGPEYIRNVAWCTGKGQNFFNQVTNLNIDAYLTGEISEETIHIAEENNIHFFSLGHHATEKSGVYLLGKWLSGQYNDLKIKFIDIYNPI